VLSIILPTPETGAPPIAWFIAVMGGAPVITGLTPRVPQYAEAAKHMSHIFQEHKNEKYLSTPSFNTCDCVILSTL
jgi:hypothetical protein